MPPMLQYSQVVDFDVSNNRHAPDINNEQWFQAPVASEHHGLALIK